jgi:hypothetical protein
MHKRAALNMQAQYTKWDAFSLHPHALSPRTICAVCMGMCSFFTHSRRVCCKFCRPADSKAFYFLFEIFRLPCVSPTDSCDTISFEFYSRLYSAAKVPNNINAWLRRGRVLFFQALCNWRSRSFCSIMCCSNGTLTAWWLSIIFCLFWNGTKLLFCLLPNNVLK